MTSPSTALPGPPAQHVRPICAGLGEWFPCWPCFASVLTCGQRPSEVRHQLEHAQMPVDDAPDDNSVRQSYNFAPGYHGLVYRADGTTHKLQAMKWGWLQSIAAGEQHADHATRPRPQLDETQAHLRVHDEDDQLPGRFAVRGPRHVDKHEEEETVHRRCTRLLRVAQEGREQREDAPFHKAQGWPTHVLCGLIRLCPVGGYARFRLGCVQRTKRLLCCDDLLSLRRSLRRPWHRLTAS